MIPHKHSKLKGSVYREDNIGEQKINADMINLLGCTKENFYKLLNLMQYKPKIIKESKDEFFIYQPKYRKVKLKNIAKKSDKNNPFDKLSEIRFR